MSYFDGHTWGENLAGNMLRTMTHLKKLCASMSFFISLATVFLQYRLGIQGYIKCKNRIPYGSNAEKYDNLSHQGANCFTFFLIQFQEQLDKK